MNSCSQLKLQNKWLYLTYLDSHNQIAGPAVLLSELIENLEKWRPYYAIAGEEQAPTTGTRHFHVIVCCHEQVRTRKSEVLEIKGVNPHLEKIHNNLKKIIEYCKKGGNIAEYGKENCPVKNQEMNKAEKAKLMLECDLKEAFLTGTLGPIEVLRAEKLRKLFEVHAKPEPYKKRLILWFRGETGEGKTRRAIEIAERYNLTYWISNDSLKWFDGYENQNVAIIDDFRKGMLNDWNFLLRLLDGYNLIVPIKGGFTRWTPQIVIITTPATPEQAFSWVNREGEIQEWDHQDQLTRRLTHEDELQVYEFPLWEDEDRRLTRTIERFLGINDQVEEELSMSPILPEPSQIDEA
nr:replication-associated protein [Porcine redondovirus 1]